MPLCSIATLTILILLINEHRISFHLFASSSISVLGSYNFLMYRSLIFLVKFILEYFYAIVNGTVFFISFSDGSLLTHKCNWLLHADFASWNFIEFSSFHSISVESLRFYFLFLAMPSNLQNLNSPTRDQTHTLGSESTESKPLDGQGIPEGFLYKDHVISRDNFTSSFLVWIFLFVFTA